MAGRPLRVLPGLPILYRIVPKDRIGAAMGVYGVGIAVGVLGLALFVVVELEVDEPLLTCACSATGRSRTRCC